MACSLIKKAGNHRVGPTNRPRDCRRRRFFEIADCCCFPPLHCGTDKQRCQRTRQTKSLKYQKNVLLLVCDALLDVLNNLFLVIFIEDIFWFYCFCGFRTRLPTLSPSQGHCAMDTTRGVDDLLFYYVYSSIIYYRFVEFRP